MIRVGMSRRTRHGSVWLSVPFWVLALVVVLFLPLLVDWWFLKLSVVVVGWLVRHAVRLVREYRRGR